MTKSTERQVGIAMFVSILSLKLLIYPALVARYAQNNAYLSVMLSFVIEFIFVLMTISGLKKNPDKTFKEIMENTYGKVVSKVVFVTLFAYFLSKCLLTMKECHNFFFVLLYDKLDWYYFIIPILVLGWFVLNRGLKSFSRTIEMCFVIIIIGTITSIFVSISRVDVDNFLPFLQDGFLPVGKATIVTNFSYGDYLILLLFAGNIKYEDKPAKKIYKYIFIANAVVILFHIVFVGVFGNVGVMQPLAVSDIPMQSQVPLDDGRLEWVNIIIWTVTLIVQILLMMLCSKNMLKNIFTVKNEFCYNVIIMALLIAGMYGLYFSLAKGVEIVISPYFYITSVIVQTLPIVLLLIASSVCKSKNSLYANRQKGKVKKMKHFFKKLSKSKTWVVFLLLTILFFPKAFYLEAESDTRAIVTAVGIDKKDDEYEVSSLMVVPSNSSDPGSNLYLVSTKGKTVGEAFNQLAYNIGKRVGLAHCDFIVVDDKVIEEDITKTIDFFVRQYNITKRAYLVNCKDGAKKMLQTALNEKSFSTVLLSNLVQKENHSTMGVGSNIDDLYKKYFSESGVTYLNTFEIEKPEDDNSGGEDTQSSGGGESEQSGEQGSSGGGSGGDKPQEKIKGTDRLLILKNGVKTCEIEDDETMFFEIYNHTLRSTYMLLEDVTDGDKNNANVGVDVVKIKCKNRYSFENSKPTITCDISMVVALYEVCEDMTEIEQVDNAKTHIDEKIKDMIRSKLQNGAENILSKSKKNNADILEYSTLFTKRKNKEWKEYRNSLSDTDNYLNDCVIKLNIKIQDKF